MKNIELDQQMVKILQILHDSPASLSWYGISIRLSNKGIVISGNLIDVLDELIKKGLIVHLSADEQSHGIYVLTDLGCELLLNDTN